MNQPIYLSIGSNLGDREKNLIFAHHKLKCVLKSIKSSSVFKTEPMYNLDQPEFLNAVFFGFTDLDMYELLSYIHTLEEAAGRDRAKAGWKGPRSLDIDILLYGSTISKDPKLILPHPGITERGFVLIPLVELAPHLVDPVSGLKYESFIENNMNFGVSYYKSSSIFDIITSDG